MSYIQTFSSVLNVSGSVTVHYPPSEHGGTITEYYDQNVPVDMNVTVNTAPFDQSVQSASYHVDSLTASVAAMNAANCAAIAECSEQVSDGIISGFYNLIRYFHEESRNKHIAPDKDGTFAGTLKSCYFYAQQNAQGF